MILKNTLVIILLSLFITEIIAQPNDGWILVFEDNFDGEKLDESKWGIGDIGDEGCRLLYDESNDSWSSTLAYSTGVTVENGLLKLTGSKMPESEPINDVCIRSSARLCRAYYNQLPTALQEACDNGIENICDLYPAECDQIIIEDGQQNRRNFPWEAGIIQSRRKFRFGKYEIRVRFPGFDIPNNGYEHNFLGTGQSAAFWFWNRTELDVFELNQNNDENLASNLHVWHDGTHYSYNYLSCNSWLVPNHEKHYSLDDFQPDEDGFFKIGIEWYDRGILGSNAEGIKFYINDKVFFIGSYSTLRESCTSNLIPFDGTNSNPMHMILSAGPDIRCRSWNEEGECTNVSGEVIDPPENFSEFPFGMEIDYVKVWTYTENKSVCLEDFIETTNNNVFYETYNLNTLNSFNTTQQMELIDGLVTKDDISFGNDTQVDLNFDEDVFFVKASKIQSGTHLSGEKLFLNLFGCNEINLNPNRFAVERGAEFSAKIINEQSEVIDFCDEAKAHAEGAFPGTWLLHNYCSTEGIGFVLRCADSYKAKISSIVSGQLVQVYNGEVTDGEEVFLGQNLAAAQYLMTLTLNQDGNEQEYFYRINAISCFSSDDGPAFLNQNVESSLPQLGSLTLFPSPFTNKITISYEVINDDNILIYIVDGLGKKIKLEQAFKNSGHYSKVFDLSKLPNGVYTIVIKTNAHKLKEKIVKISY